MNISTAEANIRILNTGLIFPFSQPVTATLRRNTANSASTDTYSVAPIEVSTIRSAGLYT